MTSHTATATAVQPRGTAARIAYATLGALLLVAIVLETARHGTGYWQIAVFGLGPDVALFLGAGTGLEKGQLHPRAVGALQPRCTASGGRSLWRRSPAPA